MARLYYWLFQVVVVTLFNLRNLPQRVASSGVTVVGVAGVVMVLVGILSMAAGFRATLSSTAATDNVIVLRDGSATEMNSILTGEQTRIIADGPGIRRNAEGAVASAELYVIVDLPKRSTGTDANVPLRGVQPAAFAVREDFRIVAGRRFATGRNEIIVGEAAAAEFAGLEMDSRLRWGENEWTVVGIFTTGGTAEDSEVWCDARVLQPAYRRGNSFQSVHAKLTSPAAFDELKDALTTDPRLNVVVMREEEYFADQGTMTTALIVGLGIPIALLMGFGAVFGALNTMYTAVSARTREIATLRAVGFGAGPVVISVLVESLLLAAVGGLAGAVLAFVAFNGFQAATLNFQTFSQVAFAFAVTPPLVVGGIFYALVMGLVGGFFPAIRAARLPVSVALREL